MSFDVPDFYKEYFDRIGLGDDNIMKTDGFISEEDIKTLIDYLATREYAPKDHNGYDAVTEAMIFEDSPNLVFPIINKYIQSSLEHVNNIYNNKYDIKLRHHTYSENKFIIARMSPGMNNSAHRDYNLDRSKPFGSPEHNVVAMIYLNETISGGEITFPENNITYKPTPGSIVTFPANYLHEVLTLNAGFRYAMMLIFAFDK
jgi:hypothetical protein